MSVIRENEIHTQPCLRFVAGLCEDPQSCGMVHPGATPAWEGLRLRWGVTPRDLDFAVLSFLCKQPQPIQEAVLTHFAEVNLRSVQNLSACLSSLVKKVCPG
eukprot:RCo023664